MKVITLRGGNFRERNYVLVKLDIVAVIVAKDGLLGEKTDLARLIFFFFFFFSIRFFPSISRFFFENLSSQLFSLF